MSTTLQQIEELLGTNLVKLGDKLDLLQRQRDKETIKMLQDITLAWQEIAFLVAAEAYAKKQGLDFVQPNGDSVVDSLKAWFLGLHSVAKGVKRE